MRFMNNSIVQIYLKDKPLITNVPVADNFWMRLSGYMFRSTPHVPGILFESSGSIQTTFMSFELDVIFLTNENLIIKIQRNVKPWRLVFAAPKSKKVLEIPTGQLSTDLMIGDILQIIQI